MMTKECRNLAIGGINLHLAITSAVAASKHILDSGGAETKFLLLNDNKEDKDQWQKEFEEISKSEDTRCQPLCFQADSPENVEKIKIHVRKSNLMILPLKPGSPLFGSEALSAIAAGVPILVSSHSGIASLLQTICPDECITQESILDTDTENMERYDNQNITESKRFPVKS